MNKSWMRKPRTPIGEPKRAMVRTEEGFYPTWEQLLNLHRLDYWHCRLAQASQPGWPDYVVMGKRWLAFVELKARQASGRLGKLNAGQERYKASIEAAAGEYKVFYLPDDWNAVDDWLIGHTGIEIRGVWRPSLSEQVSP